MSPGKTLVLPCSSSLKQQQSTIILLLPRREFYCLLPPFLIINIDFTACVIIPVWRFIFLFCISWRQVVYSTSPYFTPPQDNYLAPSANHGAYTVLENNYRLSRGGVQVTIRARMQGYGCRRATPLAASPQACSPSTYFYHLLRFRLRPHPPKATHCHRPRRGTGCPALADPTA